MEAAVEHVVNQLPVVPLGKRWTADQMQTVSTQVLLNQFVPHDPFAKQVDFCAVQPVNDTIECMYGGAAGGGKSDALLMAALMYVEEPEYSALLLRKTYKDLALPGALMFRLGRWLEPWVKDKVVHWNGTDKIFTFPSGATITFGYLAHENDVYQYDSSEFQFIGLDELTQFTKFQYDYMWSRLRRPENSNIPIRMMSASNPGGIGHEWVKRKFIIGNGLFIPSTFKENPHIDSWVYLKALNNLDPITKQHKKYGNWDAVPEGKLFKYALMEKLIRTDPEERIVEWCRFWDLAATSEDEADDPDYTVGLLMGKGESNRAYIVDVKRFRMEPNDAEEEILATCRMDARTFGTEGYKIRMEQEGGASAKYVLNDFRKKLAGFDFDGEPAKKNKVDRAVPYAKYMNSRNIYLIDYYSNLWIPDMIAEYAAFPTKGVHDDQVDAGSGAFTALFPVGLQVSTEARDYARAV